MSKLTAENNGRSSGKTSKLLITLQLENRKLEAENASLKERVAELEERQKHLNTGCGLLQLVAQGLKSGSIKAKPLINTETGNIQDVLDRIMQDMGWEWQYPEDKNEPEPQLDIFKALQKEEVE